MKSLALVLSSLSLFACLDNSPIDDSDLDTTETTRIATNGITPATASAALNINSTQLTSASISAMTTTADGRKDLDYIVGCALASGNSIVSGAYTFLGSMGIAPGWKTAALTTLEAKSVSACFLSRLNKTGTSVTLSIRGALSTTVGTETTDYAYEEGAFWGNIFSNLGAHSIANWWACTGDGQIANPTFGDMYRRRCAVDLGGISDCGFAHNWNCSAYCTRTAAGNWDNCNDGTGAQTGVMTTFLLGHL